MKKGVCFLLLAAVLCTLLPAAWAAGASGSVSVTFYDESSQQYSPLTQTDRVSLTLDGIPLIPDGSPALVQYIGSDGRTLVPVRSIAERLGATVEWIPDTRQVLLLQESNSIVLTLGSAAAVVNGQTVELPDGVPAGVVKCDGRESTMVPLRFVSEQLGAVVEWDNATFTANIYSSGAATPEPTPPSGTDKGFVTRVTFQSDAQTVNILTDHRPEYRVLDLGDRVAVDLLGAVLTSQETDMVTIPVNSDLIASIRYYQHEDDLGYSYPHTVRVVLDLNSGVTYARNLTVEAGENGVWVTAYAAPSSNTGTNTTFTPTLPTNPGAIIALDAGHGGSSPGAAYPDAQGNEIQEKDLTLAMTLKLRDLLLSQGYQVVLTREDDIYVDLYERADIANAAQADLFVSIHCNASGTVPTFQGIYTYYHPSSERGARFAQAIQTPLCAATGGIDRGIASADFVVVRETNMCAVLVETGFMSNAEELARLCDSSYQDKIVQGIAAGITSYLNGLNGG